MGGAEEKEVTEAVGRGAGIRGGDGGAGVGGGDGGGAAAAVRLAVPPPPMVEEGEGSWLRSEVGARLARGRGSGRGEAWRRRGAGGPRSDCLLRVGRGRRRHVASVATHLRRVLRALLRLRRLSESRYEGRE